LMASHHHNVMEYCRLCFLTHAFSMVQIFNLKHNDSFRFHQLQRLIIWLWRLMVPWVYFTLFVYFTIAKNHLKMRRFQLVYYRTHLSLETSHFILRHCLSILHARFSICSCYT
jgi:hypothetical protein